MKDRHASEKSAVCFWGTEGGGLDTLQPHLAVFVMQCTLLFFLKLMCLQAVSVFEFSLVPHRTISRGVDLACRTRPLAGLRAS